MHISLFIAKRLSARHLFLQYSLAIRVVCMSVTHWNVTITVVISVTSLPPQALYERARIIIHGTVHVSARVIKPRAVLPWNVERSHTGFENEGRERYGRETRREQARMHQQTSRPRETSQRRAVNYDNRSLAY